jgi:hypothetical protein
MIAIHYFVGIVVLLEEYSKFQPRPLNEARKNCYARNNHTVVVLDNPAVSFLDIIDEIKCLRGNVEVLVFSGVNSQQ